MEAIGADVGVAASALYRYFPSKSTLLAGAAGRTATLVEELLDSHSVAGHSHSDPAASLSARLAEYAAIAFSRGPDLMIYHSELGALDGDDRRRVHRAQLRQLPWRTGVVEKNLNADRSIDMPAPGTTEKNGVIARTRVHAALAVVRTVDKAPDSTPPRRPDSVSSPGSQSI